MRRLLIGISFAALIAAPAWGQEIPFLLEADELSYDSENNQVIAQGNIEIFSEYGAVQANRIVYNQKTGTLVAQGDVLYLNEQDVAVYADRIELENELRTGIIENIRARMKGYGPKMTAQSASKPDENTFILTNAQYTACPAPKSGRDSRMPWKIRAEEIRYNQEKEMVYYKNAKLDVLGVPVVWVPYFRHSVAKKKAASGVLPPQLGSSTNRGQEVTLAYYVRPSEQVDYTIRARTMTKRGVQGFLENRFITKHAAGEMRITGISDDKTGELRSSMEGSGQMVLQQGRRVGANVEIASDDTYFDDFLNKNPTFLSNNLYAEDAKQKHYIGLESTFYQDLRDGQNTARTAQPLAHLVAQKVYQLPASHSQITLDADALVLHRDVGARSRRVVAEATWHKPLLSRAGDMIDLEASLRGDIYHIDNPNTTNDDSVITRAIPEVSALWQRPMISQRGIHTIIPKAMAIISPLGGNPDEIPNEDSVAFELETSNLFDENRFAGLDRVETGPRFIYGLDNEFDPAGDARYRVFLGQSLRFQENNTLPAQGGAATESSDWVGSFKVEHKNDFALGSTFRLDNGDFEVRRMDNLIRYGTEEKTPLAFSFTHTFLDSGPEEIDFRGSYQLTDTVKLQGEARQDLNNGGRLLLATGEVIYESCCYRLSFEISRRGFENRDVPPSTDFNINIELLTLGRALD